MNIILTIIVFFFCILLSYANIKYKNKYIYILASLLLSLIVGIRTTNVPDTENYLDFFDNISFSNLLSSYTFEPGFQLFTLFLKYVTLGNPIIYFFAVSIINCSILYYSLKNIDEDDNKNPTLLLVLYYAFFGLFYNAIVIRAGIAISIVIYAISLDYASQVKEVHRKTIKIISLFALAISFHYTALLGIFVYFIYKKAIRFTRLSYLIIWLIIFLIAISNSSIYIVNSLVKLIISIFDLVQGTDLNKYSYYLTELYDLNDKLPFRVLFQLLIALLMIFWNGQICSFHFRSFNVYLVGLFLSSIFFSIEQLSRITDYFLIFSSFCLYFILKANMKKIGTAILYIFIVLPQIIFFFRIIIDKSH